MVAPTIGVLLAGPNLAKLSVLVVPPVETVGDDAEMQEFTAAAVRHHPGLPCSTSRGDLYAVDSPFGKCIMMAHRRDLWAVPRSAAATSPLCLYALAAQGGIRGGRIYERLW